MKIVGLIFEEPAPAFTCPVCGKAYKTGDGLEKHIKEKHTEPAAEPAAQPGE